MRIIKFSLIILCLFLAWACGKEESNLDSITPKANHLTHKTGSQTVVIGSYTEGVQAVQLTVSEQVLKSSFAQAHLTENGEAVSVQNVYISDDPSVPNLENIEDYAAYLIFEATTQSGEGVTFGIELDKNNGTYSFKSASAGWKCDNKDCSGGCNPVRKWFLGKVVACNCSGGDGQCRHSRSGGGGGVSVVVAIVSAIASILGALL